MTTVREVLTEALDQYVANQGEYVEISETATDTDRAKLAVAEKLLDDLVEAFLEELAQWPRAEEK